MARKRERAFAAFGAALFLITSSAFTILVLVTMATQGNKQDKAQQANQQKETNMNKLQGTKLAGFTPVANVPGLQTTDLTPGTGETVKAGDTITADYTGAVASTGIIFESSLDSGQPATFSLSRVIAGWSQGVPGLNVGGSRHLLIPASLAYGSQPPQDSGIPPNANLVFNVTVKKIDKESRIVLKSTIYSVLIFA
jgi:FKBP-type peptidyl-prolyl cis-trans isomerase